MLHYNLRAKVQTYLMLLLMTAITYPAIAQTSKKKVVPKQKTTTTHKKTTTVKHTGSTRHNSSTPKNPAVLHQKPIIKNAAVEKATEEAVYKFVDQQPQFRGDLMQYLSSQLIYPKAARDSAIEGKVYVQFVVDTDGSISQVKIIRSSGNKLLDAEAVRVIKGMPNWTPGKMNGAPVKCFYQIPINFKLD